MAATLGLLGLLFGLTNAAEAGWDAPATMIAFVGGIALLGVFVCIQMLLIVGLSIYVVGHRARRAHRR